MIILPGAHADSVALQKLVQQAWCWKFFRTDNYVIRLTEHDSIITLDVEDGAGFQPFYPAGAPESTAMEIWEGLRNRNTDLAGIVTSDRITDEDLFAGRYRECQVDGYLVNWRYPWNGPILHKRFWIEELEHTGDRWNAQLSGVTKWLKGSSGDTMSKLCPYTVGDRRCQVDMTLYREPGTVLVVAPDAKTTWFTSDDIHAGSEDDYYNFGKLIWMTGDNAGLECEIKLDFYNADTFVHTLVLQLATPYDMVAGDTFFIQPGCNLTKDICKNKFNNLARFGAWPYMPGTDDILKPLSLAGL